MALKKGLRLAMGFEFLDREELTLSEIPLYISQELPGRGIGLFASRIIESGEVIMGSPTVIILVKDALDVPLRDERHALLRKAVLQLPAGLLSTQTQIRALAKSRGGAEIDDIIQTNSITQSCDEVPEVARINHDCCPKFVFALRDIKTEEEISFNYAGAELQRNAHRSFLQTHWGFTYACSLCIASRPCIGASDQNHTTYSHIQLRKILRLADTLIELYDKEGLIVPKASYYEIAAYTCSQLGNETGVQRNAKLAADHWRVLAGRESWEVTRMLELAKDPKTHPSWGIGVRRGAA
ncbi:hypothetical protein V2W45_1485832 [Cenococcum geophilum]